MESVRSKIVITGGPGGGKTTAVDLYQREFKSRVKIVPEAATMLYANGMPREGTPERKILMQESIYIMQLTLEDIFKKMHPERLLVCDRGTLDGLAYWPHGEANFFQSIHSTREREFARYDAVIFFQTAVSHDMRSNNPFRIESSLQATELDEKLKEIWEKHPNFHYIPSESSFMGKISRGLKTIHSVLDELTKSSLV